MSLYIDEKIDYFNSLKEKYNFKNSIWSNYDIKDINDIAYVGKNLVLVYKLHWGPGPVYEDLPTNPSWLDIWKAADHLISISSDNHHIFIEDFERSNNVIYMYTGS